MTGSAALTAAQAAAAGSTYLGALLLGRWLVPEQFADIAVLVALLLAATFLTTGLQLLSAIAVARGDDGSEATLRVLQRWTVVAGSLGCLALVIGSWPLHEAFGTDSAWPFVVLGLGLPAYLAQAVGRGRLQGQRRLVTLATTFGVEATVRLVAPTVIVAMGGGVVGASAGMTLSLLATWLCVRAASPGPVSRHVPGLGRGSAAERIATRATERVAVRELRAQATSVAALLAAQLLVATVDLVVAAAVLPPAEAARYTAVALVGHGVLLLVWAGSVTLFPTVTRGSSADTTPTRLLGAAAGATVAVGASCAGTTWWLGDPALTALLGTHYAGLAPPLTGHVLAMTAAAVALLLAGHAAARRRHREPLLLTGMTALGAGALVAAGHDTGSLVVTLLVVLVSACAGQVVSLAIEPRARRPRARPTIPGPRRGSS